MSDDSRTTAERKGSYDERKHAWAGNFRHGDMTIQDQDEICEGFNLHTNPEFIELMADLDLQGIEFAKAWAQCPTNKSAAFRKLYPDANANKTEYNVPVLGQDPRIEALKNYIVTVLIGDADKRPVTLEEIIEKWTVLFRTTKDEKLMLSLGEKLLKLGKLEPKSDETGPRRGREAPGLSDLDRSEVDEMLAEMYAEDDDD